MAVAAMVAATAFPSVATAEVETADVIVQRDKAHIAKALASQLETMTAMNDAKNLTYVQAKTWLSSATIVQNILKIEDPEKRNEELKGIASRVDEMLESAKVGEEGTPRRMSIG
ncbi:hypothetical protein DRB87_15860 [Pandoraea sp. XY-2]|nr:hypothetical protein DRB87_15860 [Pandoraea sp. XY-2]